MLVYMKVVHAAVRVFRCVFPCLTFPGATRIFLPRMLLDTGYLRGRRTDSIKWKHGDGGDPLDDLMQGNGPQA
jgi:hypothetical protein